jgi:hypothetical protein
MAGFCFQIGLFGLFHDSEKGIQYAVLISLMCAYFRFHRWALLCFHILGGQFFAFIDGRFFAFIEGQFFNFN